MEYRICTKCEIHHVENCNTCFGFGLLKHSGGIISAHMAHSENPDYIICPECGGTPKKE